MSKRSNIDAALSAMGTTNNATLLLKPGIWDIGATSLTIPENVTAQMRPGAMFSIADGRTLTINGQIDAGLCKIFSFAGTGVTRFTGKVYPEWWGAVGDGTTDDSVAFYGMVKTISNGAVIELSPGKTYLIENSATFLSTYFSSITNLVINGNHAIIKVKAGTSPSYGWGLYFTGTCRNITINDLALDGNRANIINPIAGDGSSFGIGIFHSSTRFKINHVDIYDFATDNIYIGNGPDDTLLRPSEIEFNHVRLYRARRNNISLTGATDVTFRDSQNLSAGVTVGSSTGTAPKSGCDLEPNGATAESANERISFVGKNHFSGNVTANISVEGTGIAQDILIDGSTFDITSGNGILLGAAVSKLNIVNNTFNLSGGPSGGVSASSNNTASTISDVVVANNQFFITAPDSYAWNIQGTGKTRWVINNNTVKSNYYLSYLVPGANNAQDFLVQGNKYFSTEDNLDDDAVIITAYDAVINNETFVRDSALTNHYRYKANYLAIINNIIPLGGKAVVTDSVLGVQGRVRSATTTQMTDRTSVVNITDKYLGRAVWNSTTNEYVYAAGSADTDHWYNAVGSDTHTPV